MQCFPKVIWTQNFVFLWAWNLLPSYGEKKKLWKMLVYRITFFMLSMWFQQGPNVIKDCSVIGLCTAADIHHLHPHLPEGLTERTQPQPEAVLWQSHIRWGGGALPALHSLKPNFECRNSQVTIFRAIRPCEWTGLHWLIMTTKQLFLFTSIQ